MFARQTFFILLPCILLCSCYGNKKEKEPTFDFPEIIEKGEITAVTLNSSTSYFQYRMQPMGYEYDLIADFAATHNLKLNIKIAENATRLIEMLQGGEADVVAYPIQIDNRLKKEVLFCGHEKQSNIVLVQRAAPGDTILKDVTDLIGKEVYVKHNTRFHERLKNLNNELGGGIHIVDIEKDTVTTEDLIEMVSLGKIPYTACEDDVARLNRTYYRNINIDLPISFKQRSSWIVKKSSPLLAQAINEWAANNAGRSSYRAASKRYFERSKTNYIINYPVIVKGQISPYDSLFKQYAPQLGWDWQLLASIAYQESRFISEIVGWSGAEGLMGIMPATAVGLGFNTEDMKNPEKNLQAGIECIQRFRRGFKDVPDPIEKIKLTLASYNAGIGHIYDAQQLAHKYGKDPNIWDENVAEFIRLKSDPVYYTDSICKHGYLRGTETYNYVTEVLERYKYYKEKTSISKNQ
ncbi:MAG: transglycosylase SLT domain-containing protein [Tannerella sp.]|jgi:membrane-bound lytic murein transglycosylase F|nr:transglycosylase SLT domain-containing protein [Tannerella sp.]